MTRALLEKPQIIIKEGKPTAIILDIHDYEELLERIEDIHDLEQLKHLRKKELKYASLG